MNQDEITLMDWLRKRGITSRAFTDIKHGCRRGVIWLAGIRQQSAEGVEGATAALNAAERIYGKTLK